MRYFIKVALVFIFLKAEAQHQFPEIHLDAYLETYLMQETGSASNNILPSFFYSFNRLNEVNINHSFFQVSVDEENYRGELALMAGTYANANLADEPGVLQNIYRANVGVKLSKKHQLWLDMGVFDAHIGFESAIGADVQTMTRSVLAENSPYYFAGAKLNYTTSDDSWDFALLYLNGWQRIQRVDGNSTPAFGHQVSYKPNEKWLLNSSSFVGNDFPDDEKRMRYFHNFYTQYQASEKLFFTLGFDVGWEQKERNNSNYNQWYSPVFVGTYRFSEKSSLTLRGELYSDPNQVIVDVEQAESFRVYGWSINYDYALYPNILWRIEARNLRSREQLFMTTENQFSSNLFFVGTSLSVYLQKKVQ